MTTLQYLTNLQAELKHWQVTYQAIKTNEIELLEGIRENITAYEYEIIYTDKIDDPASRLASFKAEAAERFILAEKASNKATARPGAFLLRRLTAIANEELGIGTLEARNSDDLDFYDVSVWGVRKALQRAYKMGQKDAEKDVEEEQ